MSERTRDPDRRGESQTVTLLSRQRQHCSHTHSHRVARTHARNAARSEAACRMTTALRPLQRHPVARPRISLSATSDRTMAPPARSAVPPIARKDTALCVWPGACLATPPHLSPARGSASRPTSITEVSAGEGFLPSRRRCPGSTRPPRASVCRTRKSSATSSYMG